MQLDRMELEDMDQQGTELDRMELDLTVPECMAVDCTELEAMAVVCMEAVDWDTMVMEVIASSLTIHTAQSAREDSFHRICTDEHSEEALTWAPVFNSECNIREMKNG